MIGRTVGLLKKGEIFEYLSMRRAAGQKILPSVFLCGRSGRFFEILFFEFFCKF